MSEMLTHAINEIIGYCLGQMRKALFERSQVQNPRESKTMFYVCSNNVMIPPLTCLTMARLLKTDG